MTTIKEKLSRIAAWFQPAYQKIDEWDLPWLRNICKELWDIMDDEYKKALYTLATKLYKDYGQPTAEKIMTDLKEKFDTLTK